MMMACWWRQRRRWRRLSLLSFIIIIIIGCCCRSSSALLSLLLLPNDPSRWCSSWSPSTARPKSPGPLRRPNDHPDALHGEMASSLLFMTGSITPSQLTNTATTTEAKRFAYSPTPDNGRLTNNNSIVVDDKNKKNNKTWAKQWYVMYEKLKAYKEGYGNCTVPAFYQCEDGSKLGYWVSKQRKMPVKDAALRAQRRRDLDAIGFVWVVDERKRQRTPVAGSVHASKQDRFNARWNAMFDKLKEYKAEHGDCLVPYSYNCTDGVRLGHWVRNQRNLATTDSDMNPLRRRALDSIGFVWQVRKRWRSPKLEEQWNERFQLLQEYHAEHGDCLVPRVYMTAESKIMLGEWVSHQRAKHAAGKLRKDRLIRLESLGFSLRVLPDDSFQATWDRFFERLVQYKRQYGDCRVPGRYKKDPQLGRWVNGLRTQRDTVSAHERAQLDALDFCWDATEKSDWSVMFEELQRFHFQHGHCLVTGKHGAEYPGLVRWVRTLRRRGRDQMDDEQMKRLDAIDFCWRPSGGRPRKEIALETAVVPETEGC